MQFDTTTFLIAVGAIFILGILIILRKTGYLGSSKSDKSIQLLRPRDKRGIEVQVLKETDTGLECVKTGGVMRKFIKLGPGWTFPSGKTKFFGIEGTAYTAIMEDDVKKTLDLPDALRLLFGDNVYDTMPKSQREKVEKTKWGLTVEPKEKPDDKKLPLLSSEDIYDEEDRQMLGKLAKATRDSSRSDLIKYGTGVVLGAFIVWVFANMHWIKVA